MARSLAPELVGPEDIVELDLDAQPVHDEGRSLYLERFIHAAIFAARPDVMAVVHAHAEDTLPFGIAHGTKLRPVMATLRPLPIRLNKFAMGESFTRCAHAGTNLGRTRAEKRRLWHTSPPVSRARTPFCSEQWSQKFKTYLPNRL
jgi:hypothetical protein